MHPMVHLEVQERPWNIMEILVRVHGFFLSHASITILISLDYAKDKLVQYTHDWKQQI